MTHQNRPTASKTKMTHQNRPTASKSKMTHQNRPAASKMKMTHQNRPTASKKLEEMLKERGLAANQGLGQNFLVDEGVLEGIVEAAEVKEGDRVLEIGPGPGVLTEKLLERGAKVTAVELDRGMCALLEERFGECPELRVLHQDILKTDLNELLGSGDEEGREPRDWKVAANLPYYITTPVLFALLKESRRFSSITIMVQKEVAQRMEAGPGTGAYGALSLAVQYAAEVKKALSVPPSAFWPRPKVESAVVVLKPHEKPPVEVDSAEDLFRVIRGAFAKRRKTLPNALEGVRLSSAASGSGEAGAEPVTKAGAAKVMEELSMDPRRRGESLSLEEFAAVTNALLRSCDRE